MGILLRFKNIMTSNIHAQIEKAKDPAKEMKETLRTLRLDLGTVTSEMSAIVAQEERIQKQLVKCREDINKMQRYTVKSLERDDKASARKFLERKAAFIESETNLKEAFEVAAKETNQMKQLYQKLSSDIHELEMRGASLQTRETIAKVNISLNKKNSSLSGYDSLKDKVNFALDEAEALSELRGSSMKSPANKYDNNAIENEIRLLKEQLKK